MKSKAFLFLYVMIVCVVFLLYLEMQPHFFKNIILTGGNTLFPGFRDRVYKDVRMLAPTEFQVSVVQPQK